MLSIEEDNIKIIHMCISFGVFIEIKKLVVDHVGNTFKGEEIDTAV